MNRYTPGQNPVRVLRKLMIIAILLLAGTFLGGRTLHATTSTGPSDLVQFTAQGHILGFESEGVYVATGNHLLRVEFAGTDGVKPVTGQMPASDGHVEPLGRVGYPELWPGISLSYEAISGGIVQSSYLLQPGADVGQIRLLYNAPVEIAAGGNLRIGFENGWMNESAPVAWQEIDGRRIPVTVAFSLYDDTIEPSIVGFSLGQYNPAYPLMIDPTLSWNTFMGSGSIDISTAIAVDSNGNVYVAGWSCDTWGSPVKVYSGDSDAFVAKLDNVGDLQWNTFMGSTSTDYATGIAVDNSGNVYVAGRSDSTWGTPVYTHKGGDDAFVVKLDSNGIFQWNTFMGSASNDFANAITVDDNGNLYVAGTSQAGWGAPMHPFSGTNEAFVSKLNNNGVMQWNTFMGSATVDEATAIAIDGSGNLYVAGTSDATWGLPVNAFAGNFDAYVAKLNSSGILQWNTFMGSSTGDDVNAITVDDSGNLYLAGSSDANWGSPLNAHTGSSSYDAFAAKLNSSGVLQWNTFMGSESIDDATAIASDGNGNLYVAGNSGDTWGSPVNAHAGGITDAFVTKLSNAGILQWNTFMGSTSTDSALGITVDCDGALYIAGASSATWGFPINAHAGGMDASVARLSASVTPNITPWVPLLLLDD